MHPFAHTTAYLSSAVLDNADLGGTDKDAVVGPAVKVAPVIDDTRVLSLWHVQLDADPASRGEGGGTSMTDVAKVAADLDPGAEVNINGVCS